MDHADTSENRRASRLRRAAVIAGVTLAVSILVIVAVYVIAFVVLSPMMG